MKLIEKEPRQYWHIVNNEEGILLTIVSGSELETDIIPNTEDSFRKEGTYQVFRRPLTEDEQKGLAGEMNDEQIAASAREEMEKPIPPGDLIFTYEFTEE